jgi:small multidrug resistance family-3 protein
MSIIQSVLLFVLAGVCEIGGGYLVWLWMKEQKPIWYALIGSLILMLYGIVATLQPATFGRVYAAYGGIFIVLSLLWGWKVDNVAPDSYDILGAGIALIGMSIIMYAPRT